MGRYVGFPVPAFATPCAPARSANSQLRTTPAIRHPLPRWMPRSLSDYGSDYGADLGESGAFSDCELSADEW